LFFFFLFFFFLFFFFLFSAPLKNRNWNKNDNFYRFLIVHNSFKNIPTLKFPAKSCAVLSNWW
jgi:hypothetical protein